MTMSPFSRLEAAVNALETSGDNAKVNMTGTQVDLKASRRLWDTTASYLIDQSPCPNSEGSLSQEGKPPPPGKTANFAISVFYLSQFSNKYIT